MATHTIDMDQGRPEFTEEELDSINVGDNIQQEEAKMLAGKFEDAEALEKAYLELQSAYSKKDGQPEETEGVREQESPAEEEVKEESEASPAAELISTASQHFAEKGEITDEMRQAFSEMSSQDLVDAYIEMQGNLPQQQSTPDLSEAEINQLKNYVGGDDAYSNLTQWAGESLDPAYVEAFDSIVETGNFRMVQLAIAGLKAEYEKANGYEGEMLTGRAAQQQTDVFRSQAEVVAAMSDARYDRDPAYRNDVFEKLERSNIQF
jgi:hypothetical protein